MAIPRVNRATSERRTRVAGGGLTSKTRGSAGRAGPQLRTVPADGAATATTNNQLLRALINDLTDRGILTKG